MHLYFLGFRCQCSGFRFQCWAPPQAASV